MKKTISLSALTLLSLSISGCFDSDDDDDFTPITTPPVQTTGEVRVIHASPDAPVVDIFSGSTAIAALQDLDYQQASGFIELVSNSYTINVRAETPGGSATVLTVDATIEEDKEYNVVAIGDTANLEAFLIVNDETDVGDGNVRAQVLHAAPDAPTVDVYVTAPDDDLMSAQPLATLAFKDNTGQVEVPAGDYRIRITPAGDASTVVFDSGTVPLPAGADLLISATENVGAGSSPVSLVVADGSASSVILDAATPAEVRAIHAVADAPAVDVLAVVPQGDDIVLFDAAPFKGVTQYIEVAGGDYVIDVVADADNSVVAINDVALSVMPGVRYTAIANGMLTSDPATINLDVAVDDVRPLATAAQVRIFHASPSTPAVDIYVTADGEIDEASPAFTEVPYSAEGLVSTGYVQLAPGDYVVSVTPAGTKTVALETDVLSLNGGDVYTALAVDGDMEGDGPQLILSADALGPVPEEEME
uniref:DUF4397 domain-containing protein n=1 Tax=Ningiella ruwaisensis TaxID=2364274 RepID=UPI00109F8C8F|nr:DUF4397 domain-containing protein [Ningiella ruwaisensis]